MWPVIVGRQEGPDLDRSQEMELSACSQVRVCSPLCSYCGCDDQLLQVPARPPPRSDGLEPEIVSRMNPFSQVTLSQGI